MPIKAKSITQVVSLGLLTVLFPMTLGATAKVHSLTKFAFQAAPIKQIQIAGGGKIAYGDIPGSGTAIDAMLQVLRLVHKSTGVRPELGQFFQDRAGSTIGVFFRIPPKSGDKPGVAGLALVNAPSPDRRSGALVYDYSNSFRKSLRPMISRLNEEWPPHDASQPNSVDESAPVAPPAPLQTLRFRDNTGEIGLPAGWRPKAAEGGAVEAYGPNGEELYFNDSANNIDPTYPQGRNMIQMLTRNGMPLPNHTFSNSFRQGDAASFISVMQQRARKRHQPMPSIQIRSRTVGKDNSIYYVGLWDAHDRRGPMAMLAMVRVLAPMAGGSWTMFMSHMNIPVSLCRQEVATIPSIWQSFRTNDGLILAMNKNIAEQIVAAGEARNNAIDQANRQKNVTARNGGGGADEQQDANARGAQAVCNYIRGNAVIGDTQTGGQATVDNDFADTLVKANPDRLQIIQPSQFNHSQF